MKDTNPIWNGLSDLLPLEPQTFETATPQTGIPKVTQNLSGDDPLTFKKAKEHPIWVLLGGGAVLEF